MARGGRCTSTRSGGNPDRRRHAAPSRTSLQSRAACAAAPASTRYAPPRSHRDPARRGGSSPYPAPAPKSFRRSRRKADRRSLPAPSATSRRPFRFRTAHTADIPKAPVRSTARRTAGRRDGTHPPAPGAPARPRAPPGSGAARASIAGSSAQMLDSPAAMVWILSVLLYVHILGAIFWFGSGLTLQIVFIPALGTMPYEAQHPWLQALSGTYSRPIGPVGGRTLLSGSLRGAFAGVFGSLNTAYGITFVIAFVLAIPVIIVGARFIGPTAEKMAKAGNRDEVLAMARSEERR